MGTNVDLRHTSGHSGAAMRGDDGSEEPGAGSRLGRGPRGDRARCQHGACVALRGSSARLPRPVRLASRPVSMPWRRGGVVRVGWWRSLARTLSVVAGRLSGATCGSAPGGVRPKWRWYGRGGRWRRRWWQGERAGVGGGWQLVVRVQVRLQPGGGGWVGAVAGAGATGSGRWQAWAFDGAAGVWGGLVGLGWRQRGL